MITSKINTTVEIPPYREMDDYQQEETPRHKKKAVGRSSKPFVLEVNFQRAKFISKKGWGVWKRYKTLDRAVKAVKHFRIKYNYLDFRIKGPK